MHPGGIRLSEEEPPDGHKAVNYQGLRPQLTSCFSPCFFFFCQDRRGEGKISEAGRLASGRGNGAMRNGFLSVVF